MKLTQVAALCAGVLVGAVQAHVRSTSQFEQFFPAWNEDIQKMLANESECKPDYDHYRYGEFDPNDSAKSQLVNPVISCILTNMPEYRKAEMGASAVILGLLPTMLQTLGSTPVETAVLSLRRPLLSFLVAAGSPSVVSLKIGDFAESMKSMVENGDTRALLMAPGMRWAEVPGPWRLGLAVFEYVAVIAAVANSVYLVWQLGYHSIAMFAPETFFFPLVWGLICVVIHAGAVLILRLRVRVRDAQKPDVDRPKREQFTTAFIDSFMLSAFQSPKLLEWRRDTVFARILTWLLSIGTLVALIFGTLIFSSLLFFSVTDSLQVAARLVISTLICRAVVRIELWGMRECTFYKPLPSEASEAMLEAGPEHHMDQPEKMSQPWGPHVVSV